MNTHVRKNPVFWLIWLLPGAAVLGGFATFAIAMQDADRALPAIYHWDGELLDADFERARHAARLGLGAELWLAGGECRLTLRGDASPRLRLLLTNGNEARLDREVPLVRQPDGMYRGSCPPLARGKWRVALQDSAGAWSLRTQVAETSARIQLQAQSPDGAAK